MSRDYCYIEVAVNGEIESFVLLHFWRLLRFEHPVARDEEDDYPAPKSDLIFRAEQAMAWLRWLRQQRGVSQQSLADSVDISPSEVHKIETVQQECRLSSFVKICGELGVPAGWVLDLMVESNIALFAQCVRADPAFGGLMNRLKVAELPLQNDLATDLASWSVLAAILLRVSAPSRRAVVPAYTTADLKERFIRLAHRAESEWSPSWRFEALRHLRAAPVAALDRLELLSLATLELHRDQSRLPKSARQKTTFGFAPWVLTFEDARRMWEHFESEEAVTNKSHLTEAASSNKTMGVKAQLPSLLERLKEATAESGKKSELAAFLSRATKSDVPLASVSRWLAGEREPGGEIALQMLRWCELQERQGK